MAGTAGILDFFSGGGSGLTPNTIDISAIKVMMPYIFWAIIISLLLHFLIRLMQHRIMIERLIPVQGKDGEIGYISKSGRYTESYDKTSKLKFLRPMYGKERLPSISTKYFQKVNGVMFFGVQRQISLVFPNKFSPKVLLPDGVIDIDIKRWTFINQRQIFKQKYKKADFIYWLSIAAPSIVIVGTFIFFSVVIIIQVGILNNVSGEFHRIADTVINRLGG